MTSLVLIPWAGTDWSADGRFASTTPLPLNSEGRTLAGTWGDVLAARELRTLYSSKEQASVETASLVAQRSEAKYKHVEGVQEIGFGLWEGLTEEQLLSRFPKLLKQWVEDPPSVHIPDGEDYKQAAARINSALRRIAKKSRNGATGVVLGPVVMALGRCELENVPIGRLREFIAREPVWYELDPSGKKAASAARA